MGGQIRGGVGSANLRRPILAPNLFKTSVFTQMGAKMGHPKFADPTPHLKPLNSPRAMINRAYNGELKRDKLKGTSGAKSQFFVDFR